MNSENINYDCKTAVSDRTKITTELFDSLVNKKLFLNSIFVTPLGDDHINMDSLPKGYLKAEYPKSKIYLLLKKDSSFVLNGSKGKWYTDSIGLHIIPGIINCTSESFQGDFCVIRLQNNRYYFEHNLYNRDSKFKCKFIFDAALN